MPAVSRLDAKISFTDRHGTGKPLPITQQLSVTEWFGPHTVQVADGVSEQSLTALGTGGLTTITVLEITSDRNISITYGAAGSNAPVNLDANGVHAMSGTSLTALAVSNSSGATALVTYALGGN